MSSDILLVDDSTMLRMLVSYSLSGSDSFTVHEAGSADEALDALESSTFSMMLTDYHMPGVDGVELVRQVRAMSEHSAMPIIMITSDRDPVVERAAAEVGVDSFLRKPFEPRELHDAVRRLLEETFAAETDGAPRRFGAQALLDTFPYPAMLLAEDHTVVMANPAFYQFTQSGITDCALRCKDVMHGDHGMPGSCPLVEAVATSSPVERRVVDRRMGLLHVSVYPMEPALTGGRRLFMHLARPVD